MRTFLLAVSAALTLAGPAAADTRNFGITDYSKVRVEGPYKVTLTTGVPPFAKASGSPVALDRVLVEVRGDTLVIHADPGGWGGYPGQDPGPVEIMIGTHDLSVASLTGSGSLWINRVTGLSFALSIIGSGAARIDDAAADQLNISLAGTASAKLAGRAKKLNASVRGIASLDATRLIAPNVDASADGSGTIDAIAAETARVTASGPSTINFAGKPACELHVSGSATVNGCR